MKTISIYEEGKPYIKGLSPEKACEIFRSLQLTHPSITYYLVDEQNGEQISLYQLETI